MYHAKGHAKKQAQGLTREDSTANALVLEDVSSPVTCLKKKKLNLGCAMHSKARSHIRACMEHNILDGVGKHSCGPAHQMRRKQAEHEKSDEVDETRIPH